MKALGQQADLALQRAPVVIIESSVDQIRADLESWPPLNFPGTTARVFFQPMIPANDVQPVIRQQNTLWREVIHPAQHGRLNETLPR